MFKNQKLKQQQLKSTIMKTTNYIKFENILGVIAFAFILLLVGSLVYGIITGQADVSQLN